MLGYYLIYPTTMTSEGYAGLAPDFLPRTYQKVSISEVDAYDGWCDQA